MTAPSFVRAAIPGALVARLVAACVRRHPYETCGVLFGSASGEQLAVDGFALVRNAAFPPERAFAFHPADWAAVAMQAQKNQRAIVGLFHSHPFGPSSPSDEDTAGWRLGEAMICWIVGSTVHPDAAGLSAFLRDRGVWRELAVLLTD